MATLEQKDEEGYRGGGGGEVGLIKIKNRD